MDSYLHQNFVFKLMTEEVVSSCLLYSCSKDEHIDKFFHSEFMDYDRQMLGKSYCFSGAKRRKIKSIIHRGFSGESVTGESVTCPLSQQSCSFEGARGMMQ